MMREERSKEEIKSEEESEENTREEDFEVIEAEEEEILYSRDEGKLIDPELSYPKGTQTEDNYEIKENQVDAVGREAESKPQNCEGKKVDI